MSVASDFQNMMKILKSGGMFDRQPQQEQEFIPSYYQNPTNAINEATGVNSFEDFKKRISGVESNFGKNTKHPVMTSGIHEGDAAIGQYAMMPNTIQEFANRTGDKELQSVPKEAYPDYFKAHPEAQQRIENNALQYVYDKFGGDPEKAAYAWNQGHNLDPNKITPDKIETSDYVNKFRNITNALANK